MVATLNHAERKRHAREVSEAKEEVESGTTELEREKAAAYRASNDFYIIFLTKIQGHSNGIFQTKRWKKNGFFTLSLKIKNKINLSNYIFFINYENN